MSSIHRLLNLARKTGDSIIIPDDMGDRDLVILPLDRYEELLLDSEFCEDDMFNEDYDDDDDIDFEDIPFGQNMYSEKSAKTSDEDFFNRGYENIGPKSPTNNTNLPEEIPWKNSWQDAEHLYQDRPTYHDAHQYSPTEPMLYKQYEQPQKSLKLEDGEDPIFFEEPIPY